MKLKVVHPLERELKTCWANVFEKCLLEYFLTVSGSSGMPVTSVEAKVVRPLEREPLPSGRHAGQKPSKNVYFIAAIIV